MEDLNNNMGNEMNSGVNDINGNGSSMNNQNAYRVPEFKVEHQWQPYTQTQYGQFGEPKQEKKKKEKKPLSFGKVFATCVAFMLVTVMVNAAVTGVIVSSFAGKYVSKTEYAADNIGSTSETLNSIITQTGTSLTVAQVAEAVMPSVVAITSTSIVESGNPFWGYGSEQVQGAGSGIIVGKNDTELLIVTNNHVVEGTTSLSVQFTNDVSVDKAYVKGTSADNDIAVVAIPLQEIDTETVNYIKIATLGDSEKLNVGDGVIAIGNALGYGQSVTVGYVSAKDREITVENNTLTVIQTDAAINGGNSGGALMNMNGEVIGINVAKSSSSGSSSASVEGMGYAIPISHAKSIIEELSNRVTRYPVNEADKGYMGVMVITSDSTALEYYDIPEGAYVRETTVNGPADKAGIRAGDVIVAIDGVEVSTSEEMVEILDTYEAGEKPVFTVMVRGKRGYEEKKFTVTLITYEALSKLSSK